MRVRAAVSVIGLLFIAIQGASQDKATSMAAVMGQVDWSVIFRSFRIKGMMFCPKPCVLVENAFPVGLLEVSRREFRTDVAELKPLMEPFAKKPSSHSDSRDKTESTLQYAEAHAYEFVPPVDLGFIAKPAGAPLALSYLSEADRWAWRQPMLDWLLHPVESFTLCDGAAGPIHACAGSWGNYYPRHGFVTRDSEVMAAYLQALRAARIAGDPALHAVLKSYPFQPRTGHYVQMVSPVRKSAVKIGDPNIAQIETGAGARDGQYQFVHFGIFEACRGCLPTRLVEARVP